MPIQPIRRKIKYFHCTQASQLIALNISIWQENLSDSSRESFKCFVCQMSLFAFYLQIYAELCLNKMQLCENRCDKIM